MYLYLFLHSQSCTKSEEVPVYMDTLAPIDEDPCEELGDEDQPITMIPKIMHTAPSPTTENPLTSISDTDKRISNKLSDTNNGSSTIGQQQHKHDNNKTSLLENNNKPNTDKEISQIESVL